jgi:hypothetical protein
MSMTGRILRVVILLSAAFLFVGCGANLRYSQAVPEAQDFHPKRIAAFPADPGTYPDTGGAVDRIVSAVLVDKGWFADVASAEAVKRLLGTNEDFKKAYTEYLLKLKTVSFSDPDLSKRLSETIPTEAFLLVNVEYWNYTVENDNKLAKVGLGMRLVNAATGKVMWRAAHEEAREYKFFKPELPDVAKSLVKDMISGMPH